MIIIGLILIVLLAGFLTFWELYLEQGSTALPEPLRNFYLGLPKLFQRR